MRKLIIICFCLLLGSCSPVEKDELVGSWDYIQVENLNPSSEDITTAGDLQQAKPYIRFTKKNELQIFWSGKLLSSGTFRLEGKMIRYKEDLQEGGQREFPFLVKSLTDNQIVFETMSREGTRVTAVRRN
jgi:hypothetical protein